MKPRLIFRLPVLMLLFLVVSSIGGYFYVRYKFQPPTNELTLRGLPVACAFIWVADSSTSPVQPHAALLLPVRLPGCPRTCYVQFDTGAPYSLLYGKPLAALRQAYPAAQLPMPRQDTVHSFSLALGSGKVHARRLLVRPYGQAQLPADSTAPFIIGTLGTDALAGQVLVLDYPHQRFSLYARLPDSLVRRAQFTPLSFASRRVLLRMSLQGQEQQFLFDSGSSAFSLLTNQGTWQKMAMPAATPHISGVNSWGRRLLAHTVACGEELQVGALRVPLRTVTYLEGTSFWQQALMRFSGMTGMLGNEPFHRHTIIIDPQAGRFGLVQQ